MFLKIFLKRCPCIVYCIKDTYMYSVCAVKTYKYKKVELFTLKSLSFLIISVTKHVRLPEVLNTVTAELVWLVNVVGGDGGEDDLVN